MMEIQQHDGMVVEVAAISAGLHQALRETRRERGRAAPTGEELHVLGCTFASTIYRGPGGTGPRIWDLLVGGGQGGGLPPKASGAPPTPRVSNPRRRGRPIGGAPAHQGLVPLPLQPMGPPG